MGAREQPLAPRWKMQGRSPQPSMELNRLLLLTSFLLHIKEDRASPTRLVCDNRLIQKYIMEAKDMETRVGQCQALPVLSCPAVLPLVDFTFQQWKSKLNETKRREILCDLALLVGAVAGAQGQVSEECGAKQLSQLYRHANSFFLLLQTFSWEVRRPQMSQATLAQVPAGLGWVQQFVTPLSHSHPSGRTLGAELLPTLHGADPRHQHLPHLPAAGTGQAALLLRRPGQGLVQARTGGQQRPSIRGPVRLHTGFNPNAMLEQSCRTLSCALSAQEDAHRERVGTGSSILRRLRSPWRETVTLMCQWAQALLPPRQEPLL
uniref:Thrombopoietin n=1 Tax=Corvus moneduloides TaxID=1196302 RepID=A0A8C3EJP9_CORMO